MLKKSADKKNFFFTSTVYTFPLIVLLSTLLIAGIFHPGIRPRWNRVYREKLFNNFITELIENKAINPQQYWQFREKYSPGTFTINQEAVGFFQTFKIINIQDTENTDLLYYSSPFLQSTDSIIRDTKVLEKIKADNQDQVLLDSEFVFLTESLTETEPKLKKFNLWFILPIEAMRLANGFFDYTADELELLENTYWLNYTQITLFSKN